MSEKTYEKVLDLDFRDPQTSSRFVADADADADADDATPFDNIVSSVRVESGPAHDLVRIWNRGGLAGELTVTKGDGEKLAAMLMAAPELYRALKYAEYVHGYTGRGGCSDCGHVETQGHTPDCALAAALRKAEGK